jgi:hypothetical protein
MVGAMADTGWLDVLARLGPAATAAAAVVALAVGLATVRQRGRADARDQWWKRAHWALELTLSDEVARASPGYAVLNHLLQSDLATEDERLLLRSLGQLGLNGRAEIQEDRTGAYEVLRDGEEVSDDDP